MIPDELKQAIDGLLEGVSRTDLARRAQRISQTYRASIGSQQAISSKDDGLAYLITRLPATFAAVSAALREVQKAVPDFMPASLLDAGAGPGGATWAAQMVWPETSATLIDDNPYLLALGKTLAPQHDWQQGSLLSTKLPNADLVIASYALGEIAQADMVLDNLWRATSGVLIIVEPGTPAGYRNIVHWRARLLEAVATIAAPCPHDLACPIVPPDWCHFAQRLPRSRDHLLLKQADVPFEDEKFSYIAASRLPMTGRPDGRLLAPPIATKAGITAKLCTEGRIDITTVAKREGPQYKMLAKKKWGEGI